MKRILSRKRLICLYCVSVFFTGCNKGSVSTNFEIPTYETVAPAESRGREWENRKELESKGSEKQLEKESGKLISGRFDKVTGEPAFWMPKAHSAEKEDLIFFQVLDLLDGYFYYFYVTRNIETGKEVHAVVKNNYRNKDDHKILHEEERDAKTDGTERDRPSFYAQMYKKDNSELYMISIYDDGDLYVFDSDGKVAFERTSGNDGENMLELMKRIFRVAGDSPDYYDINVMNVTTDGKYAFYIPVCLSKEDYREIKDGEDIEVENYMFFYSYTPINENVEYLRQYNEALPIQISYWKNLANDATEERDAQQDWNATLKAVPDDWGQYEVYSTPPGIGAITTLRGALWKWKSADVRRFIAGESETPSSKHDENYTDKVKALSNKQSLSSYFFIDDTDGYCSLVGSIDTVKTEQIKITRTYDVPAGEDGSTETHTDSVMVNASKTASFSPDTVIERFAVERDWLGYSMAQGNIEDSEEYIIGMYKDNAYSLLRPNKPGKSPITGTFPSIPDDQFESGLTALDIQLLNQVDGQDWLMAFDNKNSRIFLKHSSSSDSPVVLMTSDLNPEGYQSSAEDQALTRKMQELAEKSEYDFSEVNIYTSADSYGRENIIALGSGEFLFTTFYNGMQLYKTDGSRSTDIGKSTSGTITRISDWPLYQAWKEDDRTIAAIGFDQTDATFFNMDIAKARVYTFDLQQQQAVADRYQIPFEDGGPAGIGRKPLESKEVPEDMKDSWEKAKEIRETAPSMPGAESVPDETIYETSEDIGKLWEERVKEDKALENKDDVN